MLLLKKVAPKNKQLRMLTMATITQKKTSKGKTVFTAQVRIKKDGVIVYRKAKNFATKTEAKDWGAVHEAESRSNTPWMVNPSSGILFPSAVDRYCDDINNSPREFGPTIKMAVKRIARDVIFLNLPLDRVNSSHVMSFLMKRRMECEPATVNCDLSYIRGILKHARIFWDIPVDVSYLDELTVLAKSKGLIGKSALRETRPTLAQLNEILSYFDRPPKKKKLIGNPQSPMLDIILFQIFSARRIAETCRITWQDLDIENQRIFVRNMKDPSGSLGNDRWCNLPDRAFKIIMAQPRVDDRIFPFKHRSIQSYYATARDWARADNVRLHDLRHEGTSHLFEMGFSIDRVQMVTQHGNWNILKRYTHVSSMDIVDKYEGWSALERVGAWHLTREFNARH